MKYDKEIFWCTFLQVGACLLGVAAIIFVNMAPNTLIQNIQVVEAKEIEEPKVPLSKWVQEDSKIYYEDEAGNRCTGMQYINHNLHYFYEDGSLALGWTELNGQKYYFNPEKLGAMATGETIIEGLKYQFLPTGEFFSGWYEVDGKKFNRDEYGYDRYGFFYDKGKLYYVSEDTGLQKGKFTIERDYYTDDNGAIYTGDCVILGKQAHFSEEGEFLYGWLKEEEGFRYKEENSDWLTGRHKLGDVEYAFDQNGYLQVNCDVGMYHADSDGKLTRMPYTVDNLDAALDEILETTGTDIAQIGEYVRKSHAYRYKDKLASREEMAVYALNNRYISCYYYEALTGLLLERAGYEVMTLAGVGFVYAEHYWDLVKTTRDGVEGWYHVDSLKATYVKKDSEMVAKGFKWNHSNYPATP